MGHERLPHIESARHLGGHVVRLQFDDGVEGNVDLRDIVGEFTGVLAPLADPAFVSQVFVNAQRTITWPGELDLDPVVLYCAVRGMPLPTYAKPSRRPKVGAGGHRRRGTTRAAKGGKRAGA